MERRSFLAGLAGGAGIAAMPAVAATQAGIKPSRPADVLPTGVEDRAYMAALAERMATPILSRMARGRLQREWTPELSPNWDGRDPRVSYMEAFARLIDGIAPWLALPDTNDAEGRIRRTLREQAVQSFIHSVDPKSPDRLAWEGHGQALVDSAYFTSALLRAPEALWTPLDPATKRRIVEVIKGLRRVSPPYQNWLLFACMNEAFLFSIGEDWDPMRIDMTIKLFAGDWYLGDGWYGDGATFHFDYYNSYVIHPMMVQVLEVLTKGKPSFNNLKPREEYDRALKRMQRFGEHLERMIGPDGAYAAIGRSLTYRIGAHHALGVLAWRGWLPETLPPAQVRAATVAAARQVFGPAGGMRNFDDRGFMQIGFIGHQPALGDWYSNAGSMYLSAEGLVALGLPASAPYWTAPGQSWTMRRAYAGMDFRKDYPVSY